MRALKKYFWLIIRIHLISISLNSFYPISQLLKKFTASSTSFKNKGINELLMLLAICRQIPPKTVVFKISGRYHPDENFCKPDFNEVAVKGYNYSTAEGIVH